MNKKEDLKFSFIIPVYNRPDEVKELLESMHKQSKKGFEIIIVEDGSEIKCDKIVEKYQSLLDIKYFFKDNSGPGLSRNYGSERITGNYCIFLDSDCILPPDYFKIVQNSLSKNYIDAYGGPDKAHSSFTLLQKAINYSMTSFFTTGGIRGGSEKIDKFHPRSFNMGYSKEVFDATTGFSKMRFGEDIDMSIRILDLGFKTKLLKNAYVYHKRRTSLRQFFKQIYNSGIARINLSKRHPKSLKLVHLAPAIFLIGLLSLLILIFSVSVYFFIPIATYSVIVFIDSWIKNKCFTVALLSVLTSYYQLTAYGSGFIKAFWRRNILKGDEFSAFNKNFYK